jgi:4-hydroxy-3-methylbut-2-enyl diphosphate reductase
VASGTVSESSSGTMKLKIEIDENSGFCFGVVNAINKAEEELTKSGTLFCLGDIVHNNVEVERLTKMGLITIDHQQFSKLKNVKVLLRAHGEPPQTYEIARKNNIEIIDASCRVVLNLQEKIKLKFQTEQANGSQIVVYGKKGHAEVNGLIGQTDAQAIVIENIEDLNKLDFNRHICLFSQTTMTLEGFNAIVEVIKKRISPDARFEYFDTICRQVANRIPKIKFFAQSHDMVLFVAGKKSSNGQVIFSQCKKYNRNSYFISSPADIPFLRFETGISIGICGATSTSRRQMEEVKDAIEKWMKNCGE